MNGRESSDELMKRCAHLTETVNAEARKAWSDPAYALRRGYLVTGGTEPMAQTVFGQPAYADLRAAMLRAVANKLVPPEWQWDIVETIGAEPEFIITDHNG